MSHVLWEISKECRAPLSSRRSFFSKCGWSQPAGACPPIKARLSTQQEAVLLPPACDSPTQSGWPVNCCCSLIARGQMWSGWCEYANKHPPQVPGHRYRLPSLSARPWRDVIGCHCMLRCDWSAEKRLLLNRTSSLAAAHKTSIPWTF